MRHLAILGLLLLAISPAWGQTAAQTCGDPNATPDQTIASCTQILQSGKLSGSSLAVAYNNRGVGYLDKRQLDEAIADFS
ncbi:MAG TPA: tetratricopeptide repeat protein, partial [Candidatus Binatia bacterium]|nr:tetratricopeptide repeat protein [Candidatus Binatia bacterium]